jgi:hypothetical protein
MTDRIQQIRDCVRKGPLAHQKDVLYLLERLEEAEKLLTRVGESEVEAPDPTWTHDYYLFTGQWMLLTDEGWEPGELKAELINEYGADAILDEVNAPPS